MYDVVSILIFYLNSYYQPDLFSSNQVFIEFIQWNLKDWNVKLIPKKKVILSKVEKIPLKGEEIVSYVVTAINTCSLN